MPFVACNGRCTFGALLRQESFIQTNRVSPNKPSLSVTRNRGLHAAGGAQWKGAGRALSVNPSSGASHPSPDLLTPSCSFNKGPLGSQPSHHQPHTRQSDVVMNPHGLSKPSRLQPSQVVHNQEAYNTCSVQTKHTRLDILTVDLT